MPPAKKFPCIFCNTEVGGKSGGVQCSYCDRWVHPKCANITKAHFELYKLPTCQYVCETCGKISSKIKKELHLLHVKQEEMRIDIDSNKEEIAATKRRVDKVERKVDRLDPAKIIQQSRDEMLREIRERESRKDNLIIHQVEEPTVGRGVERKEHDLNEVIEIMEFLNCPVKKEDIKFIFRAGERREDRPGPRPIILSMKNSGARNTILENTRKLASSRFERISITPDLTPLQRKEEDGLRKEAETRNNAMDQEERLNYQWVLVGMKGQRSLIKRRIHYQEGAPRWGGDGGEGERGRRGTVGERGRRREGQPSRGPAPGGVTARQIAMAGVEKERERAMELVRETQGGARIEAEKSKNTGAEEETTEQDDPSVIGQEEPSGIIEMEDEEEEEDTYDKDQSPVTAKDQTRETSTRAKGKRD